MTRFILVLARVALLFIVLGLIGYAVADAARFNFGALSGTLDAAQSSTQRTQDATQAAIDLLRSRSAK